VSQLAKLVAVLYVFAGSLALLCWSAGDAPIATPYVDPVAKIQAHQEAVNGASSLEMAARGSWLNPRLLRRPTFAHPPLLNWLQAVGAKLFGPDVWALRVPSLIAGAGTSALVFAWLLFQLDDLAVALVGAVLILSSHLFFILSRLGLPDALLTFWITLAMFALARRPRLDSPFALWTFGVATGAALLTSGSPGALPLFMLAAFCAISPEHPARLRLLQVLALALIIAVPWHIYQLATHGQLFRSTYGAAELINSAAPHALSPESRFWFYPKRMLLLDAPLLLAAVIALLWKRPRLLLAWILTTLVALAFQPAHVENLLLLLPALAILAALIVPVKLAKAAAGLATVLFIAKLLMPAQPWGIPLDPEAIDPSDAALARYSALHRGNLLYVVDPDDHLYAAALLIPNVNFAYPDASLADFLRDHPGQDFFVPSEWMLRDQSVHQVLPMRGTRAFLLARKMIHRP
jgi:4-amino-4-deoxy-L-arabinose transferase-like glycosyltransferase